MRKKKFIAMALVAMLSLSGLTGCSDKDKADISNKLNNKTTETTKKDDSKADNKTSESTTEDKSDNKKSDKSDSASKPSEDKKSDSNSGNTGSNNSANKPSNGSSKSDSSTSKPAQSTEKPAETKPSQPAHQHTWVDHTATRTVTEYVHHDAVYQDVTTPAVTGMRVKCRGCGKYFSSLDELSVHATLVALGKEPGNTSNGGGCGSYTEAEEVVITPAKTEHKLVKDAWDEPVQKTETYVDYQECTGCHEHRQK